MPIKTPTHITGRGQEAATITIIARKYKYSHSYFAQKGGWGMGVGVV